jgi:hypothetical protein
MNNWIKIDDEKIRHIWGCPVCGEYVKIYPNEYEEMGTPVCSDCDVDAEYLYTEILNG